MLPDQAIKRLSLVLQNEYENRGDDLDFVLLKVFRVLRVMNHDAAIEFLRIEDPSRLPNHRIQMLLFAYVYGAISHGIINCMF